MIAEFTKFDNSSNWVAGIVKDTPYTFEAKLFDEGSDFGIEGGRVSKLSIADQTLERQGVGCFDSLILNYDRGWDIYPQKDAIPIFEAVMELLENAPIRFKEVH